MALTCHPSDSTQCCSSPYHGIETRSDTRVILRTEETEERGVLIVTE